MVIISLSSIAALGLLAKYLRRRRYIFKKAPLKSATKPRMNVNEGKSFIKAIFICCLFTYTIGILYPLGNTRIIYEKVPGNSLIDLFYQWSMKAL